MGNRVEQLAERRAMLQSRCAAERSAVAREVHAIEQRLGTLDRVARVARSALLHPAVAVGLAAVVTLGRSRALHFLGRGLLLAAGVRRLLQAAKRI